MQSAFFKTRARKIQVTKSAFGITRALAVAAGATGLGAGSFYLGADKILESPQYAYAATQRTGRVLITLTACIDE